MEEGGRKAWISQLSFWVVVSKGKYPTMWKVGGSLSWWESFAYVHGLTLYLAYQHRCRHQAQWPGRFVPFLEVVHSLGWHIAFFCAVYQLSGAVVGGLRWFDAINSEQNKGTLSRMLSQPVHRDCIINTKFVAALIVIGIMLFVLGFLVMGCGLIAIGIPPSRRILGIVFFLIISVFYVAFWLNLAILFSFASRQAAPRHWLRWRYGCFSACSIRWLSIWLPRHWALRSWHLLIR